MTSSEISVSVGEFSISFTAEQYGSDALIKTTARSSSFSGTGTLDVSSGIIEKFASDLKILCDNLCGKARLCETFGEQYVEFEGDGKGRVSVRGLLIGYSADGYMFEQRLAFESVIDQTVLPYLCKEFSE